MQFCNYYLQLLDLLNNHDLMEIEMMIYEMVMNAMSKFKKDFYDILGYPADMDNVTIVPSIQSVESTFSTLRRVENVDNLSKQNVFGETVYSSIFCTIYGIEFMENLSVTYKSMHI